MNKKEAQYFEWFSGYKSEDDSWWDLWIILWSSDFCAGEYRSLEDAEAELKRLESIDKGTKFRIEHIPNAGYGDMRCVGGWRFFSREAWYK